MTDVNIIAAARVPPRGGSPWPFNSPQPPHSRQEVEFADGSRIWLRPVIEGGQPAAWLRDLGAPADGVRIDLRQFIPGIESLDRTHLTPREFAGHIASALRARCGTREDFIAAAVAGGRPE